MPAKTIKKANLEAIDHGKCSIGKPTKIVFSRVKKTSPPQVIYQN